MAKQVKRIDFIPNNPPHRTTSIGKSVNTRPKNKNDRRSFKKYRGQG